MKKSKMSLSLDDLKVESFETLPELTEAEVARIDGAQQGCQEYTCQNTCYYLCGTGSETVVCCYPTRGNGSGVIASPAPGDGR
jgi:hypothetical protein